MGFGSMGGDGIIPSWGQMANGGLMMLIWVVLIIVVITVAVAWISRLFQPKPDEENSDTPPQSQTRSDSNAKDTDQ